MLDPPERPRFVAPSHAPSNWTCAFCEVAAGRERPLTKPEHVVFKDESVTAFVSSHWWPSSPGHVLVIPNQHFENLFDIPATLGSPLLSAAKLVAVALKVVTGCDGVSTRQHNEPAGNQDVWHFHQHIFPRFHGDRLYERHGERALADPVLILERAESLRKAIDSILLSERAIGT